MPAPRPDDLPEVVRARVVALVADALPDVTPLPPSLRRVAAFAPPRRARLGTSAILAALGDDALRRRVAAAVALRAPGSPPSADPADPAEPGGPGRPAGGDAGALAVDWLVRAEGWEERLAAGLAALGDAAAAGADAAEERLRRRLERVEQTLRETRAAHREEVAELKAEVAGLRRRVGELRRSARAADGPAATAATEGPVVEPDEDLDRELDRERTARRAAEEEVAALRAELARVRAPGAVTDPAEVVRLARRAARAEREEASARARLLLDTVIDAAAGLRRELALPSADATPGERREEVYGAGDGGPAEARPLTGAQLEQRLAMPRARLLVDGYNVSKAAWPGSPLEVQRQRLLAALAPLVARTGAETTVVFDAADAEARPPVHPPRGVRVVFSPRGVIADAVLGDLVEAEPTGRVVVSVSDDREVAARAVRAGARSAPARALLDLLARG